jgi:CoA:oxalate CoA-transferase
VTIPRAMPRALDDIVVLDLTQFAAGPYCTMLLADAGARVIKIEPPSGEPYRHEGPKIKGAGDSTAGGYFLRFNRHKESVILDLKDPGDFEHLLELARTADVLVQNFRPDTVSKLGIGYEAMRAVNERLIYTSITGFGNSDDLKSPFARWPAFAIVAEAVGGIVDQIGEPTCEPHWSGVSLGDLYAGGLAVGGILMALIHRGRTGLGQHVDISMADCMISLNERAVFKYSVTGESPSRGTSPNWAPFGGFRASDGWLVIGVIGNAVWRNFCLAIGRDDFLNDPRLSTGPERGAHLDDVLKPAIDAWLEGRSVEDAARLLNERGVPAAPISTAEDVFKSPHTAAREMLVDVEYDGYGMHKVVGSPIKLSNDPMPRKAKVPSLGEHTESVLRSLAASRESGA